MFKMNKFTVIAIILTCLRSSEFLAEGSDNSLESGEAHKVSEARDAVVDAQSEGGKLAVLNFQRILSSLDNMIINIEYIKIALIVFHSIEVIITYLHWSYRDYQPMWIAPLKLRFSTTTTVLISSIIWFIIAIVSITLNVYNILLISFIGIIIGIFLLGCLSIYNYRSVDFSAMSSKSIISLFMVLLFYVLFLIIMSMLTFYTMKAIPSK